MVFNSLSLLKAGPMKNRPRHKAKTVSAQNVPDWRREMSSCLISPVHQLLASQSQDEWSRFWVSFCWVCAAGLSEPLAHYSLFCGQLQTPSQSPLGKYVIFTIQTQPLSIYVCTSYSTKNIYFSPTVQTFFYVCQPQLRRTVLPQKSEYVRPHSSNCIESVPL